jgi:hypothetical protein
MSDAVDPAAVAAIGPKPKSAVLRKLLFPDEFASFFTAVAPEARAAVPGPASLTYTQFTQAFAQRGQQPLCAGDAVAAPGSGAVGFGRGDGGSKTAVLHVVPVGLSPQPSESPQSIVLGALVGYVRALLHPLAVRLSWQRDLDPQRIRLMLRAGPRGPALHAHATADVLRRQFGGGGGRASTGASPFGAKVLVLGVSPYSLDTTVGAGTGGADVSIADVEGLHEVPITTASSAPLSSSSPTPQTQPSSVRAPLSPALQDQLQRWCARLGQHCLVAVAGLTAGCTWFHCRLNPHGLVQWREALSQQQQQQQQQQQTQKTPPSFCWHLCPVCLRKLMLVLGTGTSEPAIQRCVLAPTLCSRFAAAILLLWLLLAAISSVVVLTTTTSSSLSTDTSTTRLPHRGVP